jgi:tetratricopeptide (TPR) repeat protein
MGHLLARLDAALEQAGDDDARAQILARRAIYLSRTGSFDRARAIASDLRSRFGDGRFPRASVWTILAEGLLHTFEKMSPEGHDRVLRANTLAVAMRDQDLIASTSAWLAYWQFERWQFAGMVESVRRTLASARSDDHEAIGRVFMMLGNAYQYAGDGPRAQAAYARARHHALDAGDQATIDAMIYNKVAFGVGRLRVRACLGAADLSTLDFNAMEVASAKSYQHIAGIEALSAFIYLVEARLMMLRNDFPNAVAALQAVRLREPFAAHHFDKALIDIEIAYCLVRMGRVEDAVEACLPSQEVDFGSLDTDEQLVAAWLRKELTRTDRRFGDPTRAEQVFIELRAAFANIYKDLETQLARLSDVDLSIPRRTEEGTSQSPSKS